MKNFTATTINADVIHENQIVKGRICGMFVVLALRTVGGEFGYQVKPINPTTQEPLRGEFFLPADAVVTIGGQ